MAFPVRVETERLVLRRVEDSDADAFHAIWSDPAVWPMLLPDGPLDEDAAQARLRHHVEHWREHGFGLWAAEPGASGEVAGWIGPSHPTFVPELAAEIEIGWSLRGRFWSRGLATEGARAAVTATFEHLRPERVISLIAPRNDRSIAVARRLGMRHASEVLHPIAGEELAVYELRRGEGAAPAGGRGARPAL
jgi:RimJ/RimL family protein N-acetyltransferase